MMLRSLILTISCLYLASAFVVERQPSGVNAFGKSVQVEVEALHELDFLNLLKAAESDINVGALASYVFSQKYGAKTIEIAVGISSKYVQGFSESRDTITIRDYETAISTLQTFGQVIQKLKLRYPFIDADKQSKIHELISVYCFNSLISLEFLNFDENVLSEFKTPFRKVEDLTIKGELKSSIDGLKLDALFTGLLRLNLVNIDVYGTEFFYVHFPQLEKMHINMIPAYGRQTPQDAIRNFNAAIEVLFRNNPTVRSVELIDCSSLDYLRMANDYLPNLQEIKVTFEALDSFKGDEMHFANVKKFVIGAANQDILQKIQFDQLEQLELTCNGDCIEFITKNHDLTHLDVSAKLNSDDILNIQQHLPHLTNLALANTNEFESNSLVRFIETSEHLQKLTLYPVGRELVENVTLQELNWEIQINGSKVVLQKL